MIKFQQGLFQVLKGIRNKKSSHVLYQLQYGVQQPDGMGWYKGQARSVTYREDRAGHQGAATKGLSGRGETTRIWASGRVRLG